MQSLGLFVFWLIQLVDLDLIKWLWQVAVYFKDGDVGKHRIPIGMKHGAFLTRSKHIK